MKILASLALAGACLVASPSFAGPQGTGLTFTEEVAKKNLEKKRAAAKAQASSDCPAKTGDAAKADAKSDGASPDTCRAS
jgi:hypothetical protein